MATQGMTQDKPVSTESTERVREEMYRIIDELARAGSGDRALKAKFEALWKQIGEPTEPTLH